MGLSICTRKRWESSEPCRRSCLPLGSPSRTGYHPPDPVQAGEQEEDVDDIVERIEGILRKLFKDVYVGHEEIPGESPDQQDDKGDPVEHILRSHYVPPSKSSLLL